MSLKSLVKKLRFIVWASPLLWITLLIGCGTGTVLSPFTPTRIIAFGDAFMDVRNPRFTVNDEIPLNVDPKTPTTAAQWTALINSTSTTYNASTGYYLTAANSNAAQFQNGVGGPISKSNYYSYLFNSYLPTQGFISALTKVPYYTPLMAGINVFSPALYDTATSSYDLPLNPEFTVIERIAADYGFTAVVPMTDISSHIVPSSSGVYSFAQANALVLSPVQTACPTTITSTTVCVDTPQSYTASAVVTAAGGLVTYPAASTPALSVQAQIDLFLANNSISTTDMIVINAGTADIMLNTLSSGGASGVTTASQNFVSQVMRLRNAGAKHIVVFGPPNMGRSPFAYKYNLTSLLSNYSKTLASTNCTDFNCSLELGLQQQIGTISQNPVIFVDISSQTSLITGTTTTGSANTYTSFADPIYGVAIAFPGDPAFSDASSLSPTKATDGNYYCNSTNIPPLSNTNYPNPFYISGAPVVSGTTISSLSISGSYPNLNIGGSACYANPASPTSQNAVNNSYSTLGANGVPLIYTYLSYAYADPIYFTPSVHRMLGDFILTKLSLASWR